MCYMSTSYNCSLWVATMRAVINAVWAMETLRLMPRSVEDKYWKMARAAQAKLGDHQPYGGAHVLEWMAEHAHTHEDWKVVGCAMLSYVFLWRVGESVLWTPKHTDIRGRTFWSIKRSKRLVYRPLGLVPSAAWIVAHGGR